MAMRRPRIKATALLTTKRKSRDVKSEQNGKPPMEGSDTASKNEAAQGVIVEASAEVTSVSPIDKQVTDDDDIFMDHANFAKTSKFIDEKGENTASVVKIICEAEANNTVIDVLKGPTTVDPAPDTDAHIEADASQVYAVEKIKDAALQFNAESENDSTLEQEKVAKVSFKCPPRVGYNRNNSQVSSVTGSDDVFYSDMEEAVLQADLQRSANGYPMSPSKAQVRQRIRPVPVFQRRNSFVGIANSPQTPTEEVAANLTETTTPTAPTPAIVSVTANSALPPPPLHPVRRERHYSASMSQAAPMSNSASSSHHHYAPHKFTPLMGRIRTESNCSAFSDSYLVPSKMRKTEDHNHRAYSRRDFEARLANGALDKSSLKMFDLIYYNPVTNPMEQRSMLTIKKEATTDDADSKPTGTDVKPAAAAKIELDSAPSAMPVPQLKLNANGDLILDEKTLEIETTAEQEARKVLANSSLIVLDDNTGMNGFYRRQKRTKEWPPEETIKFYRCLQTIGTDFSLMCQLFPKRTRRDLKLKFKKEERSNLALINKALLYPKTFNIDELKVQLVAEERQREEDQQRWKEIKEREAKSIKKVKVNTSVAARVLKNGDDVYQNENVIKRKLSKRAVAERNKTEAAKAGNAQAQQPPSTSDDEPVIARLRKTKVVPAQSAAPNPSSALIKVEAHNEVVAPIKIEHVKLEQTAHKVHTEQVQPPPEAQQLEDSMIQLIQIQDPEDVDNLIQYEPNCNYTVEEPETEMKLLINFNNDVASSVHESSVDHEIQATTPVKDNDNSARRELEESDIQKILTELAEGSLVLVSTLDPDNADKVVNEIYMLDNNTGELCDTPLDIPEEIVQSILSVMC